ncbi:hypothetical protein I79_024582 [Cricetulus griseus]|uniref:Uncharacterized protein n=1 Tax=Cricetulus griseus TaxID=10029 RepID=G3IL22_CRIGR|nr:hypothetical protein I79_024582 [Cricetulus griseus]
MVSLTHKICRTDIQVQSSVYIKPDLLSCPLSTPHLVTHPSSSAERFRVPEQRTNRFQW